MCAFIQRSSWPRISEWLTSMSVLYSVRVDPGFRSDWPICLFLYSVRVDPWFWSEWLVCLIYTAFELTHDSGVIEQYVCFIQRSSWPRIPELLTSMSVLYSVLVDPVIRSDWPVCLFYTAFELTQDSGVVDQYGAKKMLQIFNMNPTTEDVTKRYTEHHKEGEHERRHKQ